MAMAGGGGRAGNGPGGWFAGGRAPAASGFPRFGLRTPVCRASIMLFIKTSVQKWKLPDRRGLGFHINNGDIRKITRPRGVNENIKFINAHCCGRTDPTFSPRTKTAVIRYFFFSFSSHHCRPTFVAMSASIAKTVGDCLAVQREDKYEFIFIIFRKLDFLRKTMHVQVGTKGFTWFLTTCKTAGNYYLY